MAKFSAVAASAAVLLLAVPVFGDPPATPARPGDPNGAVLTSLDGRRFEFTRTLPLSTFSDMRIALKLPGDWSGAPQPYPEDPILHGVNSASGAVATVESFNGGVTGAELVIRIDKLTSAGDYDLPVLLGGAGSPTRKITLLVRASDGPAVPLLVVFLGVAAGMGSRYLTRQGPAQLLRADVSRASSRLVRLLARAQTDQTELEDLSRMLAGIDMDARYLDPVPLRTRLEAVETRLTEIERRRGEQRTALQTDVRNLADRLDDQIGRWIDFNAAEKARADELTAGFTAIQQALVQDRLDDADDLSRDMKRRFGSLVLDRARRFLAAIQAGAVGLPEAEQAKIQAAETQVLELLDLRPLDLLDKLPDLNRRIGALERVASASRVALPFAESAAGKRTMIAVVQPADVAAAADMARRTALQRMAESVFWLTVISLAVALVTGWPTIYLGKAFGGFSDYVTAFVWGFGLNAATRSAADAVRQ